MHFIQMQKDLYFGQDSVDVAHTYTNMGLCYRSLKNLDKADELCKKYVCIPK